VRAGSRGCGGNLSCEWVSVVEVGDRGVVVRTTKYSEAGVSCRTNRQVFGQLAVRPLFDYHCVVGPSPCPRQ
jgi:hypothetical protein